MEIYILMQSFGYEGEEIEYVFMDKQNAIEKLKDIMKNTVDNFVRQHSDAGKLVEIDNVNKQFILETTGKSGVTGKNHKYTTKVGFPVTKFGKDLSPCQIESGVIARMQFDDSDYYVYKQKVEDMD